MAPKQLSIAQRRARLVPVATVVRPEQCVPYGRVSTAQQEDDETIKVQQIRLRAEINAADNPELPVKDQRKLVREFWDDGVSGTIPFEERSHGRLLVGLICNRANIECEGDCGTNVAVDSIWITRLDRMARRLQILIDINTFLRAHQVSLRCLEYNIDTSTPTGELIFAILGAIAQWERDLIVERTQSGRRRKASEGVHMGGQLPLGFKRDSEGYLIVDDELMDTGLAAYQLVQQIFENVALHKSTSRAEAIRTGLPDKRIRDMLHNPRYMGVGGMLTGDGEWVDARENKPPQIVSPEIWHAAQSQLTRNQKQAKRNRQYPYLLAGLLTCCQPTEHEPVVDENGTVWGRLLTEEGLCGRVMAGRVEWRPRPSVYYYCARMKRSGQKCTNRMLRGDMVETAVWNVVEDVLRHPGKYLDQVQDEAKRDQAIRQIQTDLTQLVERLSRLDSERRNVLRYAEKGMRTEDEALTRVTEIMAEIKPLDERRAALELQLRSTTLAIAEARQAASTITDIGDKLDEINRWCVSEDPALVAKGLDRKMQLIKTMLRRAEVRREGTGSRVDLTLQIGATESVVLDKRSCQGPSDSTHNVQPIFVRTHLLVGKHLTQLAS